MVLKDIMDKEPQYMGCIGYSITIYTGWTLSGSAHNQLIEHSSRYKPTMDADGGERIFKLFYFYPQNRATDRLSLLHTAGTIREQFGNRYASTVW